MTSLIEPICEMYDPDAVFQHFRVVEFPMSIVGLSTSQKLDLEVNFNKFAYLRTVCEGKLMVSAHGELILGITTNDTLIKFFTLSP